MTGTIPSAPEAEERHRYWMGRALSLASQAWGQTHPNPMVGAVLVEGDAVLAEGFHAHAGEVHAERGVLQSVSTPVPENACLYITLEPCSTHGRTPPCTDIILQSGVRQVVVGTVDPNPSHAGRGIELLREAGVDVTVGVLEAGCRDLNLIFNHRMETGKPLVAVKSALTLDGRIATRAGQSQWITGSEARADVMRWRAYFPAIGVGAGTVLADNPRLTIREGGEERCPVRMVFDRRLILGGIDPLPTICTDDFRDRTIVLTEVEVNSDAARRLVAKGVEVVRMNPGFVLTDFLSSRELDGLWIEGGMRLVSELYRRHWAHYQFCYLAPRLLGDPQARSWIELGPLATLDEAFSLREVRHAVLGDDVLMRGWIHYGNRVAEET